MSKKTIFILVMAVVLAGAVTAACLLPGNSRTVRERTANSINNENMTEMKTMELTKAVFLSKIFNYENNPTEWKYLGDKPAIIDFYASWCGPCKAVAPVLEELAAQYDGEIYIYKVNTEKEQELAGAFGIRSIPTFLFIPMEGAPQMAQGAMPKAAFEEAIQNVLLK